MAKVDSSAHHIEDLVSSTIKKNTENPEEKSELHLEHFRLKANFQKVLKNIQGAYNNRITTPKVLRDGETEYPENDTFASEHGMGIEFRCVILFQLTLISGVRPEFEGVGTYCSYIRARRKMLSVTSHLPSSLVSLSPSSA